MTDNGRDAHGRDFDFEPTGREPELPGFESERAPMLGGRRRQWPSIAAYLLAEQHRAHRRGSMGRVWSIRRMRARIQARNVAAREESHLTGEPFRPLSDGEALDEIRLERREVVEELAQCRRWLRRRRAAELEANLAVIDEVLGYWEERVEG